MYIYIHLLIAVMIHVYVHTIVHTYICTHPSLDMHVDNCSVISILYIHIHSIYKYTYTDTVCKSMYNLSG